MKLIKYINLLFLFFASLGIISSCKKTDENPGFNANEKGNLTLHFDNVAGSQDLILNSKGYKTSYGDSVQITKFQYYISNIILQKTDGTKYTIPQDSSYFLVQESDPESQEIQLKNIPLGDYNGVTFTVGVDSLRNVADVSKRKGVLDIGIDDKGGDMYWSWNMGYVFLKIEGTSPLVLLDKASGKKIFLYHIGGFGGMTSKTINNLKTILLTTGPNKAMIRNNIQPEIHLVIDALKSFGDGTAATVKIDLANSPIVMWGDYSKNLANNYVSMFEFDHVHNDVK